MTNTRFYLVEYSRRLGGSKTLKRLDIKIEMSERDLKSILCDDSSKMRYIVLSIARYFVALLEILLGIRFVLKFLGASEIALVVDWIYSVTDVVVAPFDSIFSNFYMASGIVDIIAISAMIGYFILALIIFKILDFL